MRSWRRRRSGPSLPDRHPAGAASDRALGARLGALALVSALALAYVAQASAPPNVVRLPAQERLRSPVQSVARQKWAFFSQDLDFAHVSPYRVRGDALLPVSSGSGDASWTSGRFDRDARALRTEVATLALAAERAGAAYEECRGSVRACLDRRGAAAVANGSPHPRRRMG